MTKTHGTFPFGKPNTERPLRPAAAGTAEVMVVGVYPSAWHVQWAAPTFLSTETPRKGRVAALAVDVEPEVFWNGADEDFNTRLEGWKGDRNFVDGNERGQHGTISSKPPSTNGSSGRKVEKRYLAALGIPVARAAFTDICPVFFVKHGGGKRRAQGTAIEHEYNAIAATLSVQPSSLPPRPKVEDLVHVAVTRYAPHLIQSLEEADAPLVVTLGEEVLQTMLGLRQLEAVPPADTLPHLLEAGSYGTEGALRVNGRRVRWLPLTHPGRLAREDSPLASAGEPRTGADDGRAAVSATQKWDAAHQRWELSLTGAG